MVLVSPGAGIPEANAQASIGGRILFARAGEIYVSEDGSTSAVTQGGRYWGQPDWAPDGSHVALVGWGPNSTDIFVLTADRAELNQITRGQSARVQANEWMFYPRWSPDGQSIAYLSDRTSQYTMLWLMRTDGGNQRQLTRPRGSLDAYDSFVWSPDGNQIAATGFSGTQSQIYVINVARPDNPRTLTSEAGSAYDPSWSPDGRFIAYAAKEGSRYSIKVIDSEGNDPATVLLQTDMARSPRWSPSGSAIAYLARGGPSFELFTVNIGFDNDGHPIAGRPNQLTTRFGVDATSGLSWAP